MRFLITGGAGFLKSHLTDALLEHGDEVTIIDVASDLKMRHHLGNPRFRFVRDCILKRHILAGLISRCDLVHQLEPWSAALTCTAPGGTPFLVKPGRPTD
jgi:UDP-glucose 4-epimerase